MDGDGGLGPRIGEFGGTLVIWGCEFEFNDNSDNASTAEKRKNKSKWIDISDVYLKKKLA